MARLLLVDDDIAEISAVKRVLARASLAPVLATNASDALASLTQRPADLLLVGATCEGGEAIAMARRLEEDPATRGLPLIVLGTAPDAPAHAVQLPRPIDPAALAEQVQLLLSRRRPVPAPAAAATPPAAAPSAPAPPRAAPREAGPGSRPAFERRGPPIDLPEPLERRARPSDPTQARRAAAQALRARADELRRAPAQDPAPAAAEAAAGLDALFELAPPEGVDHRPAPEAPVAEPGPAVAEDLPAAPVELEPQPFAADVAEVGAAPPEDPAAGWFDTEPPPPDGPPAPELSSGWLQPAADAGAFLAETPFDLPPELELTSSMFEEPLPAPPAEADGGGPPPGPPAAGPPTAPAAPAQAAARRLVDEVEEHARAQESLAAEAGARLIREAEGAARQEAEARRLLEGELSRLRAQLDADREAHEVELKSALARSAAEAQAVAELRLHEARQAGAAAVEVASAEAARRAGAEAQARGAEALEALRAQAESEAARRGEAEAALARLSEEATRLAAERVALVEAAAVAAASLVPPAGTPRPAPAPAPAGLQAPGPSLADASPPDAAQEAARRRALALRQRREPSEVPPPPAWLQAFEPPPAVEAPPPPGPAAAEPEPEPLPPATPPDELRAGNLEDLPAPRLLALAAQARLGGRLDVSGDAARSLWFEGGRVEGAASNVPGERIEEVALRLGLLTREQHHQVAGAAAALASRRAALLLVERGYLKPAELTSLVRRRTEEVVYGIFADGRARFRWVPDPVPPDERVSPERPPLALAVEGVRRRWLAPRADAVLGGPASILAPAASAPSAAELGLSPEERRLVALADGLRTLDEVLALSPLDDLSTRQLLAAAVLTGALSVRVVHAGRPAAQVAAAIDLARVKEKLEQVRRADYFTILGIGRVSTPHEVRQAADRLLAELTPERFHGTREEGLPARLEEIRRVVGEAREVLADDQLRAEYLRGLPK